MKDTTIQNLQSKKCITHTRITNHPSHMRKGKRQNVIGNLIYIFFNKEKNKISAFIVF